MTVLDKTLNPLMHKRVWIIPCGIALILMIIAEHSFIAFHSLLEFLVALISFLIFTTAWSTKEYTKNNFLIFIACGYLWLGTLNIMHTLLYTGTSFVVGNREQAMQFGLVAHYLEALLLFAAPFAAIRKQNEYLLVLAFGCIVAAFSFVIFQGQFPLSFIAGIGITHFHIYSQSFIILILAAALVSLFYSKKGISEQEKKFISAAIVITIFAEFAYVFYIYEAINLISHVLKFFSSWLIFNAVIAVNLKKPYADLRTNKENFRRLFENSEVSIWNEDFSGVINALNKLREKGVSDLDEYLKTNRGRGRKLVAMVKVHHVNKATLKLFAAPSQDAFFERINETFMPSSIGVVNQAICAIWNGEKAFRGESLYRTLEGKEISCIMSFQIPEKIEDFKSIPVTLVDITHRKKDEERIWRQGNFDTLTGLVNRNLFSDRLANALDAAKRNKTQLALLYLDLDGFKHINDTLGHLIGDLLLQEASKRLLQHMRKSDTVARLGGDEFAILLPETGSTYEIETTVKKIQSNLVKPFNLQGHDSFVSASIGITIFPNDGLDTITLLRKADSAMYKAKEKGRNNFQFFTPEFDKDAMRRKELEAALHVALDNNDFFIKYQPVINIETGKVESAEALIRWNHPTKGIISPDEFIPLAEEIGIIVPIGEWVLREACKEAMTWPITEKNSPCIAVNLSSRQFQRQNIAELVQRVLSETGLPAQRLVLEITERLLLVNNAAILTQLQQIRHLGVKLSVDDFGTGYSSLSYLKKFPVNCLKIDRSFIMNLPASVEDAALVNAILSMAHSLGMTVVAEGVETKAQADFMRMTNCTSLQGFLYSKPLAKNDFSDYLKSHADKNNHQKIAGELVFS